METTQLTTKTLFSQENVQKKFHELLGKKAQGFITSVLQIVASNELLSKADPNSVFHAAAVAATLDLPLNNNLGLAYIVPYNDRKSGKCIAQFQMGYKGFIQLSQRSGQFKTINCAIIYEGQLLENNPLKGFKFDFNAKKSDKIIGYAAYMELLNGFEKTAFMTIDELKAHANRFSQTYKKGFGLWKDDFDSMASKTVLKLLLSKFAPLSIETLQKAVITDQAFIEDAEANKVRYIDNETNQDVDKISIQIDEATELSHLEALEPFVMKSEREHFEAKKLELTK